MCPGNLLEIWLDLYTSCIIMIIIIDLIIVYTEHVVTYGEEIIGTL